MKLLQNILVPTDFGASADRALDVAIMLAKQFDSRISLLHVMSTEAFSADMKSRIEKSVLDQLKKRELRIQSAHQTPGEVMVEKGAPFERIIHVAQEKNVNVIIVGAGDKHGDETFKMGITVGKLMRKNQIPLWVVKNEDILPLRKMICPVDFSDAAKRALQNAITLAERFDAELNIVHVVIPVHVASARFQNDTKEENDKRRAERYDELKQFVNQFDLTRVKSRIRILQGEPFVEILKETRSGGYDLLLMGTTGKTLLSKLFMGSVTEKVTREIPCSFITTKAKDITDDYLESNLNGIESILQTARAYQEQKHYDEAVDNYLIGLKQYPDNIPILKGLIESYKALGNEQGANYYRNYARKVIERLWGIGYLSRIELP